MVTESQVKIADALWAQAKTSTQLAHDSWRSLAQSLKALVESYRSAGFPYAEAARQVEKHMADHQEAFKAALEHLLRFEESHRELLRQFRGPAGA